MSTVYDNIEALGLPDDRQSWTSIESGIFAELIAEVNPKTIIEVGSWKGCSAIKMAQLAPDARLYCVDTWLGSIEHHLRLDRDYAFPRDPHGYPTLYHQFLTNVKLAGVHDRIEPIPLPSLDGCRLLMHRGVTADLIYIDAAHDMESCYQDIRAYWTRLRPGGIMFGDDVDIFFGVHVACQRFACEKNLVKELDRTNGFFVIRKPLA